MKYVCSYSGGKDSTATVILAHEHNEPLDLILFSEVMFDENISGELPEHIDFIKNVAFHTFESWGYKCEILHSNKTYLDCFYHIVTRGKCEGKTAGFPMAGKCVINRDVKIAPIKKWNKENADYIHYVGIAPDEPIRLARAKAKGQISLLDKYGVTEPMAKELCKDYGLLSPSYEFAARGGCWFCPNARYNELKHLREKHPELWNKMLELEKEPNLAGTKLNTLTNMGVHDWEELFENEENQVRWF